MAGTLPLAIVITLKKVRTEREDYISIGIREKKGPQGAKVSAMRVEGFADVLA